MRFYDDADIGIGQQDEPKAVHDISTLLDRGKADVRGVKKARDIEHKKIHAVVRERKLTPQPRKLEALAKEDIRLKSVFDQFSKD